MFHYLSSKVFLSFSLRALDVSLPFRKGFSVLQFTGFTLEVSLPFVVEHDLKANSNMVTKDLRGLFKRTKYQTARQKTLSTHGLGLGGGPREVQVGNVARSIDTIR